MIPDVTRDRIRRLRTIGEHGDALAHRLALERALAATDLHPRGLPARAIVCVRSMRVTAPRVADLRPWADGLNGNVDRLLSGVVRPFRDAVPASASAVVFFDEAELIACLARDWRRGDGRAWWWVSLFGGIADEQLVQRILASAPMFVPAAIHLLAHRGLAHEVISALRPEFCDQLCAPVAMVFGVSSRSQPGSSHYQESVAPDRAEQHRKRNADAITAASVVLRDVMPELQTPSISPEQSVLVAFALVLHRKPGLASYADLLEAIRELVRPTEGIAEPALQCATESGVTSQPIPALTVSESSAKDIGITPPDSSAGALDEPLPVSSAPLESTGPATIDTEELARDALPDTASHPTPIGKRSTNTPFHHAIAARQIEDYLSVESDFAGTLYLINLATHLDLYGDFTQPLRHNELPIGDFLALIGQHAYGEEFRNDGLWMILARISGRDADEDVVHDFASPHETHEQWLHALVDTLEIEAARLLETAPGEALRFLSAQPGRLMLSGARLDATFAIGAHPFAIRASGLDRNPGWVPTAGRVIEFHYE